MSKSVTTPLQLNLALKIAAEREINGIEMGVLSNGAPYLTLRGLALMCGVSHTNIVRITTEWQDEKPKPRVKRIREIIKEQGADDSVAFIAVMKDNVIHHAFTDSVCMAVLEYYAFEAQSEAKEHALKSYRLLARKGFIDFIYSQVGYNPSSSANIAWQQFHDRVSLTYHTVPDGYFSVFKELADMQVTLIQEGAQLGKDFIPDISVGLAWSNFWKDESLDILYGERRQYNHSYPDYFPQSAVNPQPAFCYPDEALGEFRKWVKQVYYTTKFPAYMNRKVKDGGIPAQAALAAIEALAPKQITRQ